MRIGLALNAAREIAKEPFNEMKRVLRRGGAKISAVTLDSAGFSLSDGFLEGLDIVIAFGGDGTLLRCSRDSARFGIPVLGINIGHLGFLTETGADDLATAANMLIDGDYFIEERMMLSVAMPDGKTTDALNDAVMSRSRDLKVLYSDVYIDSHLFDSYSSDGVLVSTPTGSTAYSLSCGGPVISPRLDCMVLCPICPHSLRGRPVVLSPDETVKIALQTRSEPARIDADGQFFGTLEPSQSVIISRSERKSRFARLSERGFYSLLREKLTQYGN